MNLQATMEVISYGTTEGVSKAWDTRGRGRTVVLYHGAGASELERIQKLGFKRHDPHFGVNQRRTVSVTKSLKIAHQYGFVKGNLGDGRYGIVRLAVPRSVFERHFKRDPEEERSWLVHEDVPARYVKGVKVYDASEMTKKQYRGLWKPTKSWKSPEEA